MSDKPLVIRGAPADAKVVEADGKIRERSPWPPMVDLLTQVVRLVGHVSFGTTANLLEDEPFSCSASVGNHYQIFYGPSPEIALRKLALFIRDFSSSKKFR